MDRSTHETAWRFILGNQTDSSIRDEWRVLFPNPDLERWKFSSLHRTVLGLSSTRLPDSLSQSVNVDTIDALGRTALSWSSQRGDIGSVRFLLTKGANTNLLDISGCSPLAWTARAGHQMVAEELLCHGAETIDSAMGPMKQTAIHRLVLSPFQDKNFLRLLVQHGADIDAQDSSGDSPLMLAVDSHRLQTAMHLIALGCQIATQDQWGRNAFSHAITRNLHSVTTKLIELGADHTTELAEEGSFLHLAAADADLETLRILANAKLATRNIHQKRRDGLTATDVARQRKGVSRQWREAFRAFLISVTEIRVFGPEEAWSDSEDVEH